MTTQTKTRAELLQELKAMAACLTTPQLRTLLFVAWALTWLPWPLGAPLIRAWGWAWTRR